MKRNNINTQSDSLPEKKCKTCQQTLSLSSFNKNKRRKDGYNYECKQCVSKKYYWSQHDKLKQYRDDNRVELGAKAKEYRQTDRAKKLIKEANKRNYKKNKVKYKEDHTKWKKENPDWHRNYYADKYKNDPYFKLTERLRNRTGFAIKKCKGQKSASTLELLGCTIEHAREHLEKQFTEGMTWDNHGEWHIDHIIPCASFDLSDPEQQKKCFHYTNLQPLWAKDNLIKGARY